MSDWRTTVRSEAEQVVEYHGESAHDEALVDDLVDDSLFREIALSYSRLDNAVRATSEADDSRRYEDPLRESKDDLLGLMRDRALDVLDIEEGSTDD